MINPVKSFLTHGPQIYIYIYIVARFNSSRVDSTYECQTPQNATLTDQERQEDVQLKVC